MGSNREAWENVTSLYIQSITTMTFEEEDVCMESCASGFDCDSCCPFEFQHPYSPVTSTEICRFFCRNSLFYSASYVNVSDFLIGSCSRAVANGDRYIDLYKMFTGLNFVAYIL